MRSVLSISLAIAATLCAAPANWVEHKDPQGFVIKHPPGWVVETPEKSMVVVHDPSGVFEAIAYGFLTRPEVNSKQWLEQKFPARFAGRFPQARLEQVVAKGQGQSTVLLNYAGGIGGGRASILCSINGGAGMMFAISAPSFRFDERKGDLVEILKTFTMIGGGAPAQGGGKSDDSGVQWTRWTDPAEGAYSFEVPKGWRVEGGTLRRGAVDVRQWNKISSPDGKTAIYSGDPQMPSMYVVPSQMMMQMGQREGQPYAPGSPWLILRYQPGVAYAEQWARKIGRGQIQIRDRKERHDLEEQMRKLYPSTGVAQQVYTYGEVSFTTAQGEAGYAIAGTQMTTISGMSNWFVSFLGGFTSPQDQAKQTFAIATHISATRQQSAQWTAAQQKTTMEVSRINHETAEYISKAQSDSYWARQKSQERTNRNFDDYIRGVQRVVDPETGREYEAAAGSNYYYRVHATDHIVGTNSTSTPNVDVTLLIPVK
jgi:hypothetical protein